MSTAEEHKALGNEAFAAKDFEKAIGHYTDAIKADPKNHVFFSNRSASYASLKKYPEAISDAKECIKLNPTFIKGYYRLATAQIENNDLDGAITTCKQGMNVDPGNKQLEKLSRQARNRKSSENKAKTSGVNNVSIPTGMGAMDSAHQKEFMDLQNQLRKTGKDFQVVQASIASCEKSLKMNEITMSELENIPAEQQERKMYRGVGKMFMLESKDEIFTHLKQEMTDDDKKLKDMQQKKDYLEKRIKSQQQNIIECLNSAKN